MDSLEHPRTLPDTILDSGLVEKISDWEPAASLVPDATLDGRLMEGTTYLEHSALGVSLDSGLMEGMSSPEPMEQSVFNTLWVARPGRGITEETSDWEPVAHPVPDATLDGRLMEGTSWSIRLWGYLWTVEQSVLNTLSAARPEEGTTEENSDWQPVAHPVPKITLYGRLMEGTTYLEQSVLGVSLDSGLMEGTWSLEPLKPSVLNNTLSATQPEEGITEELSYREPVALPVPDITLDGRPMEGTTYLEHSALGVSLDNGLMAGMSRLEPFEQSVLSTLLVTRPVEVLTETDTPEHPALASQVDYGHSNLVLSARPILDTNQAGNAELDTEPSEHSAPMANGGHVEHLPSSGPLEHSVMEAKWRNANLNSSNERQFGSDLGQSSPELEDAIRREILRSRLMGRVSARDMNGLLLSPENGFFEDQEMPLDEVRSEGLRQ